MEKTIRRNKFVSSWKRQLGKIILFPHGKDNYEKIGSLMEKTIRKNNFVSSWKRQLGKILFPHGKDN